MLLQDLRYALRTLHKAPMFAAAVVLTLALGIGGTTAIFSVVNAVLLQPLPFGDPGRLVFVNEKNDKLKLSSFGSSVLNYLSWREEARSFDAMGAVGGGTYNLTGRGEPETIQGATISPSLLALLGIRPVAGREFREGEDRPGASPVAMVGEALWRRRFAADPALVGQQLDLNGTVYTVVGIAPPALTVLTQSDLWTPLIINRSREARLNHVITTVARLKRGITLRQAQAEMDTVARHVGQQYPEVRDWGIHLETFFRTFVPRTLQTALWVLLAAVAFVLLIGCANVANLLLSRGAARQTEMALRTAIGAGRGRLVRQLLTESALLSLAGGVAGVAGALWAVGSINRALPANLLPVSSIAVDRGVLLFALALSSATGVIFGLVPAWHAVRADLMSVLRQGGRSSASGGSTTMRNLLVASALALATVLLVGAGLLIQTLLRLQKVDVGFNPRGLLTFQLSPPPTRYPVVAKRWPLYRSLLASLDALPGVRGAAVSTGLPMGGGAYTTTPAGPVGPSVLPADAAVPVDWRAVSPGYFRLMQIPLLRGREFTAQDGPDAPPVMIISRQTARTFWGDTDPIGRTVLLKSANRQFAVVGVVGEVRNTALAATPGPAMYIPAAVRDWPVMDVVVRTYGSPESVLPAIRRKVREIDSDLPVAAVRPMEEWISGTASQPRLNAALLGTFAAVALFIAALGVYGVLSYSVNRRIREIGVRMALGAPRGSVVRLIVRQGMTVGVAGIAAGLIAAWIFSRVLATLLFGIEARDPVTFGAVAAALGGVALLACLLPARRAARIDPMLALREE